MVELPRFPKHNSIVPWRGSVSAAPAAGAADPQVRGGARVTVEEGLFAGLAVASVACWVVLARWYSLLANRDNTHFAFEKVPGYFASPVIRGTLALFLALALTYAAGYVLLRWSPTDSPIIRLGVVTLVVGPAIANVLMYPVGALDVFNYLIELKLTFFYDQNPYLVTFAAFRDDPFALPAFLVDTPLFYGPAWLLVSGLPAVLVGFDDVVRLLVVLKVFNLALLALTAVVIFRYHEDRKRGWLAAYLFLANPLVLFEGVANAHNDVLMTLLLVGGLLALKRGQWSAGPLLTLSVLVKLFTAALAPLFVLVALAGRWSRRAIVTTVLVSLAVVVGTVAPYWAGGEFVDGLRRGTAASQQMDHVSVVSLAQQYSAQVRASQDDKPWLAALTRPYRPQQPLAADEKRPMRNLGAGLFALAALVILWRVKRGGEFELAVVATLMLFALLLTNLYAWYLIPIFAVMALRRDRLGVVYVFVATALGLAYYPAYVYAHFNSGWPKFQVHLFLSLFLTVPMLAYLAAEAGRGGLRWLAARRGEAGQVAAS